MFTGRRLDDESGLYYYRARYYNPEIGRFFQADPIGYLDSNEPLYLYCVNRPTRYADPLGLYGMPYNLGMGDPRLAPLKPPQPKEGSECCKKRKPNYEWAGFETLGECVRSVGGASPLTSGYWTTYSFAAGGAGITYLGGKAASKVVGGFAKKVSGPITIAYFVGWTYANAMGLDLCMGSRCAAWGKMGQ